MLSIDDRLTRHSFFAFAAPETIPAIAQRIEKLVRTGRRMTLVRRYLTDGDSIEIRAGLTLETEARSGGIDQWEQVRPVGSGLQVHLKPGIHGFGVSSYVDDVPDEDTAAARWHDKTRPRRNLTLVEIEGHGDGFEDRIRITHYNDYKVGIETTVVFDLKTYREESVEQIQVVEAMRAHQPAWTAEDLQNLAQKMSYTDGTVQRVLESK